MRKLKVKDIAPAVRLANALNLKNDIKKIATKSNDAETVGLEIIGLVLTKYSESDSIQKLVTDFFAGPFEMSADDINEMDFDEFINSIKEIGGVNALTSFFGNALK